MAAFYSRERTWVGSLLAETIVTLVLLAALVLGVGKSLVTGALPTAS
tara:strand:+ start:123 stop:263 length:141 start_codon:yes stop_codon:yes gene_type:complete